MTVAPHQRLNKMETTSIFEQMTKEFLDYHPQLDYQWISNNKILGVKIYKKDSMGFDVFWGINKNEIYYCAGDHHHSSLLFNSENSTFLFGMLRDLLSKNMRILEKHAGNSVYKVIVQAWDGKSWVNEDISALIFFNYFGKRSEKIFQNNIIKGYCISN